MFGITLKTYNLMSGQGFGGIGLKFWFAWGGLAIIAILIMLGKKWLGEEEIFGLPFNWFGSFLGVIVYFLIVTFTGSYKIAFVGGLIGYCIGGFGLGATIGGTE